MIIKCSATVPADQLRSMQNFIKIGDSYSMLGNEVYLDLETTDKTVLEGILSVFEGFQEHSIIVRGCNHETKVSRQN